MTDKSIARHTPGPWKARAGFDCDTKEIFRPNPKIKKPFYPTDLAVVRSEDAEGRANVHLFIAAPDLLAALEDALTMICEEVADGHHTTQAIAARSAIAKAHGVRP